MREKILVTKSSIPPMEEYIEEIQDIWQTHWLTNMGVKHQKLQEALKDYLGVENVDLLTNGHMALELSLQALNLKGEVISTPFTFASTTHAIIRNGLEPVFCDINNCDFTIDANMLESLISEKTSAILPVHVYGNVCDVEAIEAIAKKYDLKVIYDAAHAFGVKYKGKGIGTYGDVSCFSFHATKVFNTIEGGAVSFLNREFGEVIYNLKNFGIRGPENVVAVGANAKMNEFCAAMGLCNLRHIGKEIAKRKRVVETYREYLEGVPGLQLNPVQKDVVGNFAYFPLIVHEDVFGCGRDEVIAKLAEKGIFARKYFYPLTNSFEAFHGKYDVSKTPIAYEISKRVLTLPLYGDLEIETAREVCQFILACKSSAGKR